MNIAKRMTQLVERFKQPFNTFQIYLTPECKDMWNDNYAICQGFYYEYLDMPYFNRGQFEYELQEFIKTFFEEDRTVKVIFRWTSQELEVYRG